MGMDGSGLSVADALALQRDGNGYGNGMFGDGGYWIFFLFFLLAWGKQWLGQWFWKQRWRNTGCRFSRMGNKGRCK